MKGAEIRTWADGFGRWHAEIVFPHTLSESDPRPEFNLDHQWAGLRRRARAAVVREITLREQKTGEPYRAAESRVRRGLLPLEVAAQNIDSVNRWHGVTFGEPAE